MLKRTMMLMLAVLMCLMLMVGCDNNPVPTDPVNMEQETEIMDTNETAFETNPVEEETKETVSEATIPENEEQTEPQTEPATENQTEAPTQPRDNESEQYEEDEEVEIDMSIFGDNFTDIG